MSKLFKYAGISILLLSVGMVSAQVFPDNEARKAILELRVEVKRITEDTKRISEENKKTIDKIQSEKQGSDLEIKKANDVIAILLQSKRDLERRHDELQQEISKFNRLQNQAVLQLKSDNDALKQQIAELRGEREQLSRDITILQRTQKDITAGTEERVSKLQQNITKVENKFEPLIPVSMENDGLDIQTTQSEKKEFERALATFKKNDFTGAVTEFTVFLRKYPNSGFRQSALFWLASTKFAKFDFTDTSNQLEIFKDMNGAHKLYPEAMFMLAKAQIELKLVPAAKKTLEELIRDHRDSKAAKDATDLLPKLKLP